MSFFLLWNIPSPSFILSGSFSFLLIGSHPVLIFQLLFQLELGQGTPLQIKTASFRQSFLTRSISEVHWARCTDTLSTSEAVLKRDSFDRRLHGLALQPPLSMADFHEVSTFCIRVPDLNGALAILKNALILNDQLGKQFKSVYLLTGRR